MIEKIKKIFKKEKPRKFVIGETKVSYNNYHIREVKDDQYYFNGGAPNSLCGKELGWDVRIPFSAWDSRDNYSSWCKECKKLYLQEKQS